MDVSRLRQGEKIVGVAAILFIIIMFLQWWKADVGAVSVGGVVVGSASGSLGFNAWEPSSFMDIIWFLTALSGVALAYLAASQTSVSLPIAMSAITTGLGILSTLLIIIRIIDPPYSLSRSYGVFLGLIAMGAMTYGGWMAMQEEGTSFSDTRDRLQDRTGGPGSGGGGGGTPPPPSSGGGAPPPPSSGGTPPSAGGTPPSA